MVLPFDEWLNLTVLKSYPLLVSQKKCPITWHFFKLVVLLRS
jgi:hypothetical protein